MQTRQRKNNNASTQEILTQLQLLRQSSEEVVAFWPHYLSLLASMVDAKSGVIVVKVSESHNDWSTIAVFPPNDKSKMESAPNNFPFTEFEALNFDQAAILYQSPTVPILALELMLGESKQRAIAAFVVPAMSDASFSELRDCLQLVADVPASYQQHKAAVESGRRVEMLAGALDFMVLLDQENRFLPAAMVFCNELAARHNCDSVSLGWLEKGYVKVRAISHRDNFERKSEAVQCLEAAMEEVVDQDTEVLLPRRSDDQFVDRDHKVYGEKNDSRYLCSIPLRLDEETIAVCTCERSSRAFDNQDLSLLRLECDRAVRRLSDLKQWDRWIGSLLASRMYEKFSKWLGVQHTWSKVLVVSVATLLAVLCFVKITYRVEASAILRSEDVRYLSAPFDGHIENVEVKLGDYVEESQPLLQLDQNDLRIEEAGLIAEQARYQRELEKARATNALADMRIAEARFTQVGAQLDLIRYRLKQSTINSPFSGIVVEGNLNERVGSPVRQGDELFKVAKIDNLYVELEVDESEISYLGKRADGELSLASRPQESIDITMMNVEPVAVVKDASNVFMVRYQLDENADWWRPGMTGVAKINTEKRTLLWILTHRTVEFLRLYFWW